MYDYHCQACEHHWEEARMVSGRDVPLENPCPGCNESGQIKRVVGSPRISYNGALTVLQRAGSGWNDVLNKVKKNSGKYAKIETR